MRVLLIDVNCKYSSTGKIVYDLYNAVNNSGDEAAVCYGRGEKINEKNIFKFGIDVETYIHALLTRLTGYTGGFSPVSTWRLLRFMKKFKPDVVHIHELHAYFVNIKSVLKYLKEKNIPVVHTLHSEFSYTGKCGHADECTKWMTQCDRCPKVGEYPKSSFFDHTRRMFEEKKKSFSKINKLVLTTPSEWLTRRAEQSFFKTREIITVHNGIDTDVFCYKGENKIKERYGISEQQRLVLSVAPDILSQRKGGEYVLRCAEELDRSKFFFVLIGADKETDFGQSNVLVLPKIKDKQLLADFYSAADVFVLCSKKETFSLTCAEALCCGTPIVGFKCGAPEMIFSGQYASFTEYGDVDGLSALISEAANGGYGKSDISAYAHREFSNESMLNSYLCIYKKMTAQE